MSDKKVCNKSSLTLKILKVAVLTISGTAKSGKSFLANRFLNRFNLIVKSHYYLKNERISNGD